MQTVTSTAPTASASAMPHGPDPNSARAGRGRGTWANSSEPGVHTTVQHRRGLGFKFRPAELGESHASARPRAMLAARTTKTRIQTRAELGATRRRASPAKLGFKLIEMRLERI